MEYHRAAFRSINFLMLRQQKKRMVLPWIGGGKIHIGLAKDKYIEVVKVMDAGVVKIV